MQTFHEYTHALLLCATLTTRRDQHRRRNLAYHLHHLTLLRSLLLHHDFGTPLLDLESPWYITEPILPLTERLTPKLLVWEKICTVLSSLKNLMTLKIVLEKQISVSTPPWVLHAIFGPLDAVNVRGDFVVMLPEALRNGVVDVGWVRREVGELVGGRFRVEVGRRPPESDGRKDRLWLRS